MERVTLRMPRQQLEEINELVDDGDFPNQSEAIRTAVREMLIRKRERQRPRVVFSDD